jgi:Uma2 family endonuclease
LTFLLDNGKITAGGIAMVDRDEFYYGRRQIIRYDKTGQPSYTWQPLQPDDFLDPQEGDEFAHSARHERDVQELVRVFRYFYRYNPSTLVLNNIKLQWAIPGLPQPAPDLAVVPNLSAPEQVRTVFDVQAEGVAPRFILEVTSPRFVAQDCERKPEIYASAGVQEYFIVDSGERPTVETLHYAVTGYRLQAGHYVRIEPDDRDWVYSTTNRLWLGVNEARDGIVIVDSRTGERVEPDETYIEATSATQAEATFRAQSIAAQLGLFQTGE